MAQEEMASRRTERIGPFIRAAREGDADTIRIFINSKANIDIQDDNGDTLFIHAVRSGQVGIASILRQAGADTAIANLSGETALDIMDHKTEDIIKRAKKISKSLSFGDMDHPLHNKALMDFYHANEALLTLEGAIALARAITVDLPQHDILGFFFRNRQPMTTDDAIALARVRTELFYPHNEVLDKALWDFVQIKIGRDFSIGEALALARAAGDQKTYERILRAFFDAKGKDISPEGLKALADATSSHALLSDIRSAASSCKEGAGGLL